MVLLALAASACSGGSSASSSTAHDAASEVASAAVPVPAAHPIGLASLDAFAYRRGPGRADYERARKLEDKVRSDDDRQAIVDACRAARAADPGHLEAAWVEAVALAGLGKHDEMLEPLSVAIAGDWVRWGERSVALKAFDAFLASPAGEAWRQLVEEYRAVFAEAVRGAVVVLGRSPGGSELAGRAEVYAYAPGTQRWLRLTHTGGTVVAALPAPDGGKVAYVAYRKLGEAGATRDEALTTPGVAVIELATGRVGREIELAGVSDLRLGWKPGKGGEPTLVAATRSPTEKQKRTWVLDWKRRQKTEEKVSVGKDALVVARGVARRLRAPVAGVTADWDDDGLASAIRLDDTRKTVTPPAGLVVDGHALVWSPDHARLALVAVVEGDCAAPARLFVVDAGTGKLRELGGAASPAPAWIDATHVAYTSGDRVIVVDATTAKPDGELTSTAGVATAIVSRPCAPPSDEALFAPGPDEAEVDLVDPTGGVTSTPVDAGVELSNDASPVGPPTPADPPK